MAHIPLCSQRGPHGGRGGGEPTCPRKMHSLPTLNRCLNPQGAHTAYFLQRTPTPRDRLQHTRQKPWIPRGKPYSPQFSTENPLPGATLHSLLAQTLRFPYSPCSLKPLTARKPGLLSFHSFNLGTCSRQGHRKRCSPAFPRSGTSARGKPTLSASPPLLASSLPRPPQPPSLRGALSSLTKLPL